MKTSLGSYVSSWLAKTVETTRRVVSAVAVKAGGAIAVTAVAAGAMLMGSAMLAKPTPVSSGEPKPGGAVIAAAPGEATGQASPATAKASPSGPTVPALILVYVNLDGQPVDGAQVSVESQLENVSSTDVGTPIGGGFYAVVKNASAFSPETILAGRARAVAIYGEYTGVGEREGFDLAMNWNALIQAVSQQKSLPEVVLAVLSNLIRTTLGNVDLYGLKFHLYYTKVDVPLFSQSALQTALAELSALETQVNALVAKLAQNNCADKFPQLLALQKNITAAKQSKSLVKVQQTIQAAKHTLQAMVGMLAPTLVIAPNSQSGNPGQKLDYGVTATHICGGSVLQVQVAQSQAGPAVLQGAYPNYTVKVGIANPKQAGDYALQVGAQETILNQTVSASATTHVNNVAPSIGAVNGASGKPGERVQFAVVVADANAESVQEIKQASVTSDALQDVAVNKALAGPGQVKLTVQATVKKPKKDQAYDLKIAATDKGGLTNNKLDKFQVLNVAPVITALSATPAVIPPSAEAWQSVLIKVRFDDDNTLADIEKVEIKATAQGDILLQQSAWTVSATAKGEAQIALYAKGTNGKVQVQATPFDQDPKGPGVGWVIHLPVENVAPVISGCGFGYDASALGQGPANFGVPPLYPVWFGVIASDLNGDKLRAWLRFAGQEFEMTQSKTSPSIYSIVRNAPAVPGDYPVSFRVQEANTGDQKQVTKDCGVLKVRVQATHTPTPFPTHQPPSR